MDKDRLWFPELRHPAATDTARVSITEPGAPAGTIILEQAELTLG